jgi:Lon-like protease
MVTPQPDSSRLPPFRVWFLGFLGFAVLGFLISAAVIELPYYAFRPGSVRDTRSLVVIDGTETYVPEGSISYTTVSLRPVTLVGLVAGWLDADTDIHPRDEVLGDNDADENRQLNLALMDSSKLVATQVALEELGYDVHETATGNTVLDVIPDSPADGVLEMGDTIVAVDGERIDEPDDLISMLSGKRPGDQVTLAVEPFVDDVAAASAAQDGAGQADPAEEEVTVELAADPDDPNRGIIGIQQTAAGLDLDIPIDVSFDTGDVGGPSAGLAFTLALIDELTPGELTGGVDVAATGEIHSDGTVGAVGGTGQKAAAVRQEGVEVFLVPDNDTDFERAAEHAGDVDVIRVGTLDEALEALAELGGNGLALPQVGAPSTTSPAS